MPTNSPAMWQYNGLVLLAGYLQRLHVEDEILQMLGTTPQRCEGLPQMLECVASAMTAMEERALSPDEQEALLAVLSEAEGLLVERTLRPRCEAPLAEQVAVVGGAVAGEKRVNDGLVTMGRLFDPRIAERFRGVALFHEGRMRIIATAVRCLAEGGHPPRPELGCVERWYDELFLNQEGIRTDLRSIARLIAGQSPAFQTA